MAIKKTATKTSSRAKLNVPTGKTNASSKSTASSSAQRKTASAIGTAAAAAATVATVKTLKGKNLIAVLLCFIIGIAAGVAAFFVVSKNDTFELIGGDEITLFIGDEYVDDGVKVIEFGKDVSDKVSTESNLVLENGKATELGTFYIKYFSDTIKYGKLFKIEKIRLINVVEISEGGE